ncbi:hypothetical protein LTS18_003396 [Coniosporium uncinatum]|uniref:Uncharacterized protein n=1 Tax=Coniosporium uncinatum TaxID=93489 RepID=A0ACC3DY39_9PEZI|nr:hypothetical protein LTS18_003396 [Coniosporium uncinatum]
MALFTSPIQEQVSPGPYPPLAQKINRACGGLHEQLSDLIIDGLPNALPPISKDTRAFAAGLASFGMIYLTYEACWDDVVASIDESEKHSSKVTGFLATVRPKGIERTTRIKRDLDYMRSADESLSLLCDGTEGPKQKAFRKHIQSTVSSNPHTLYAYAWCMYMAVFAGGRYIREELAKAGNDFWRHHGVSSFGSTKPAPLDRLGYSFLSFDGDDDGLSIETEFKKRLHEAGDIFTDAEKDDVVAESKKIFYLTMDLIREMDERIKPDSASKADELDAPPQYTPASYFEEKGAVETDSMLGLEADEEELMRWRDPPMHRGPLFWLQMVLLVTFFSLAGCFLIVGTKLYVWWDKVQEWRCASAGAGGHLRVVQGGH